MHRKEILLVCFVNNGKYNWIDFFVFAVRKDDLLEA